MATKSTLYGQQAEERLQAQGLQATAARTTVFAALLESGRALTHHDILTFSARLRNMDRVTVYRVLQWLEHHGLVHKFADEDRVWRFMVGHGESGEHSHFKCERCGSVTCLEDVKIQSDFRLPTGYSSNRVELTVLGLCAICQPPRTASSKAKVTSR